MHKKSNIQKSLLCNLDITNNARSGIKKWANDEQAFFSLQDAFDVYIEKRSPNKQGNMTFLIYFDNKMNNALAKRLNNRVAVMDCIYKNEGFLATGFQVKGRNEPVMTNRRFATKLKFNVGRRTGIATPIELYTSLRELPIADERSEYVKKRISSWEGYLRIQERNADVADLTVSYSKASFNKEFNKLSLVCNGLNSKDCQTIAGFSVKMKGQSDDIGTVTQVLRSKRIVEIELNRKYQERARQNGWFPKSNQEVVFSNFAELSQVRRLRKGFKDLQDGLAANANLERILFEERPTVQISKKKLELTFHNELNEFQKEAVTGAMLCNDLYVIQGPPGTGKTTVISEICHQNVKAGLRTLVASQANLAVDNALSRLLSHQDSRILRYGRTESIEEEGKRFIEENVSLHWKNQTFDALNEQIKQHPIHLEQIVKESEAVKLNILKSQEELALIDEKIRFKEITRLEHIKHQAEVSTLRDKLILLKQQQDESLNDENDSKKLTAELEEEIAQIEEKVENSHINIETEEQIQELENTVEKNRQYINYRENLLLILQVESSKELMQKEIERITFEINHLHAFTSEIETIFKIDLLISRMKQVGIVPHIKTNKKMGALIQLITLIKSSHSLNTYSEWKKVEERLDNALKMVEKILKDNGFLKQLVTEDSIQKPKTVKEIDEFITRVGRFLINPSNKKVLESRHYSAQKYENLEKLSEVLQTLIGQKKYIQRQCRNMDNSKLLYTEVKSDVTKQLANTISELQQKMIEIHLEFESIQLELSTLNGKVDKDLSYLSTVDDDYTINQLYESLESLEGEYAALINKKALHIQNIKDLENKRKTLEASTKELMEHSLISEHLVVEIGLLTADILKQEEKLHALLDVLKENPEDKRQQTLVTFYALSKKNEDLSIEKEKLPITHSLQKKWLTMLSEANEYDLEEIRKMYVRHANVIGTTCVASASRNFMEEYPTFDVVIIDEVSKATPPELLLPMLKGKKVILVGDHHQLPPLMGQETLEELLEESDSSEVKEELRKLLQESLFERLFRTLPKENKTMLGIQYRMHESIMQTIAPFYKEGNYRLQCGLKDSDKMRDHLISSKYIKRNDHLLWFDMPNEPNYFEEQVKGGTSRFNNSELTMVSKILIDLDSATGELKQSGELNENDKKSVGIISFYGEQVKKVNRLIDQELLPKHLNCRTGSVDKFQGMEMDIIILSFVRNHNHKGGDIGFAKDYRRLNVALSRARELLIIVGSSDMFTKRPKNTSTKEMYSRLLDNVRAKDGLRNQKEMNN